VPKPFAKTASNGEREGVDEGREVEVGGIVLLLLFGSVAWEDVREGESAVEVEVVVVVVDAGIEEVEEISMFDEVSVVASVDVLFSP
jgi:hypothetical protein